MIKTGKPFLGMGLRSWERVREYKGISGKEAAMFPYLNNIIYNGISNIFLMDIFALTKLIGNSNMQKYPFSIL